MRKIFSIIPIFVIHMSFTSVSKMIEHSDLKLWFQDGKPPSFKCPLLFIALFKKKKKNFFLNVGHFKSLYWISYIIASVLGFGFFGWEACGILACWQGIEPSPPTLEGKVLNTGLPGKSLNHTLDLVKIWLCLLWSMYITLPPATLQGQG